MPTPHPGSREVLVRVAAAAILASALKWTETDQAASGEPLPLPITGRDFSGVVAVGGDDIMGVAVGEAIFAVVGRDEEGLLDAGNLDAQRQPLSHR